MTPLDIRITQDMITVALLATPLLSLLKPYLSLLPIAAPAAQSRNAVLTGAGILLNLALLVGMLYAQDALDWHYWFAIVGAALGQQAISAVAFSASKTSAGVPTATTTSSYPSVPPFGSVQVEPPDPPVAPPPSDPAAPMALAA